MALSRREFVVALLAPAFAIPLGQMRRANAESIDTNNLDKFERLLKAGLRARRPVEFAFIALVVDMVRNGKLPKELVQKAFVWVRNNKKKERYPAVWFEFALRALAAREGITIP